MQEKLSQVDAGFVCEQIIRSRILWQIKRHYGILFERVRDNPASPIQNCCKPPEIAHFSTEFSVHLFPAMCDTHNQAIRRSFLQQECSAVSRHCRSSSALGSFLLKACQLHFTLFICCFEFFTHWPQLEIKCPYEFRWRISQLLLMAIETEVRSASRLTPC